MDNSTTPRWKFVGGRLCLDFVNTVGGRRAEKAGKEPSYVIIADKLDSYDDLAVWARDAGIVNSDEEGGLRRAANRERRSSGQIFARARALRESLFKVLLCAADGRVPPQRDFELVNREYALARRRQKLIYSEGGFAIALEGDETLERIIWPLAISGGELLLSKDLSRVKQCPGVDCGWLFLDESRNGRRQWCDMKDCGNLAKVRRFRERQR